MSDHLDMFLILVTFIQDVALNSTCIAGQPSDQCSDPKAECTSSLTCYCKNGYFENSGNVCTKSKFYKYDFVPR